MAREQTESRVEKYVEYPYMLVLDSFSICTAESRLHWAAPAETVMHSAGWRVSQCMGSDVTTGADVLFQLDVL